MSKKIVFGEILEFEEGYWFEGRKEMMATSFHRKWAAGIDGNGTEGTSAIVLSGGYEDDQDLGDEIIYTGAGGNNPGSGKQVRDQSWKNQSNAGLLISRDQGLPVRVVRGHNHKSEYSPKRGYVYAGLYSVVDAWEEIGKSGYKICRFRLEYSGNNKQRKTAEQIELDYTKRETERKEETILRIIRDTKIIRNVKKIYNYECQVCRIIIRTKSGNYAEGAHIRPLGRPHDGDDNISNIICLCPNHHVMFDKGIFSLADDLNLIGDLSGKLFTIKGHNLEKKNLKYHRKIHGYD